MTENSTVNPPSNPGRPEEKASPEARAPKAAQPQTPAAGAQAPGASEPPPPQKTASPQTPAANSSPDSRQADSGAAPPRDPNVPVPVARPKHFHPLTSVWKAVQKAAEDDSGRNKLRLPSRKVRAAGLRFRRQIWHSPWRRFLFLTITPALLVLLYNLLWASPIYVSTAMFAIKSPEHMSGGAELASFFLFGGGPSKVDSYVVINYAHSWELFAKINGRLDLTSHYSDKQHDFISRLKKKATQAELLNYWKSALKIIYDPDTGIITSEIRAYNPEMAQRANAEVIALSEERVNSMNERSRRETMAQALAELNLAEKRLEEAKLNLQAYREQTKIIDPRSAAGSLEGIIGALEQEAAVTAAELAAEKKVKSDLHPDVRALRRRLEGVHAQLAEERAKLSDSKNGQPGLEHMNAAMVREFERLYMAEEFAKQQYALALHAQEAARVRAELKNIYLVAFQPPIKPDEARYPRILYSSFLTFLGSVFILSLGSLIWAAIKEHAGFL